MEIEVVSFVSALANDYVLMRLMSVHWIIGLLHLRIEVEPSSVSLPDTNTAQFRSWDLFLLPLGITLTDSPPQMAFVLCRAG